MRRTVHNKSALSWFVLSNAIPSPSPRQRLYGTESAQSHLLPPCTALHRTTPAPEQGKRRRIIFVINWVRCAAAKAKGKYISRQQLAAVRLRLRMRCRCPSSHQRDGHNSNQYQHLCDVIVHCFDSRLAAVACHQSVHLPRRPSRY